MIKESCCSWATRSWSKPMTLQWVEHSWNTYLYIYIYWYSYIQVRCRIEVTIFFEYFYDLVYIYIYICILWQHISRWEHATWHNFFQPRSATAPLRQGNPVGTSFTIGRGNSCDVALTGLTGISVPWSTTGRVRDDQSGLPLSFP